MKKKLLIIGSDISWEERALLKASKKIGTPTTFMFSQQIKLGKENREIFSRSLVIVRRVRHDPVKMLEIVKSLDQWKIPHTDSTESIVSNLDKSLFLPGLSSEFIHEINTIFWRKGEKISPEKFEFPLLLKPSLGRHGEGIHIATNKRAFLKILKKLEADYLIQPYLHFEKEYRVLVIGGKAIGSIEKKKAKNAVAANYSQGAKFLKKNLPQEILNSSVDLCRQLGIDIGGVDLAKIGKIYYLLEVNRCPEFRAFTKTTRINVAEKIIQFATQKYGR